MSPGNVPRIPAGTQDRTRTSGQFREVVIRRLPGLSVSPHFRSDFIVLRACVKAFEQLSRLRGNHGNFVVFTRVGSFSSSRFPSTNTRVFLPDLVGR